MRKTRNHYLHKRAKRGSTTHCKGGGSVPPIERDSTLKTLRCSVLVLGHQGRLLEAIDQTPRTCVIFQIGKGGTILEFIKGTRAFPVGIGIADPDPQMFMVDQQIGVVGQEMVWTAGAAQREGGTKTFHRLHTVTTSIGTIMMNMTITVEMSSDASY